VSAYYEINREKLMTRRLKNRKMMWFQTNEQEIMDRQMRNKCRLTQCTT